MKVKELIEILREHGEECNVCVRYHNILTSNPHFEFEGGLLTISIDNPNKGQKNGERI